MPFGIGQGIGSIMQAQEMGRASRLEYQASRDAIAEQRRQQRMEEARLYDMWNAWNANRAALMQRYGLSVPEATNPFNSGESEVARGDLRGRGLIDLIQNERGPGRAPAGEWG